MHIAHFKRLENLKKKTFKVNATNVNRITD